MLLGVKGCAGLPACSHGQVGGGGEFRLSASNPSDLLLKLAFAISGIIDKKKKSPVYGMHLTEPPTPQPLNGSKYPLQENFDERDNL
jgi:hypothetical protein